MSVIGKVIGKCTAKKPTFFGMICGEDVVMDAEGRLQHLRGDKQTFDHSAEIEGYIKTFEVKISSLLKHNQTAYALHDGLTIIGHVQVPDIDTILIKLYNVRY